MLVIKLGECCWRQQCIVNWGEMDGVIMRNCIVLFIPGHCLQHSPGTVNCSATGQGSGGQWVAGSSGRHCIDPLRQTHSVQWRGLTTAPCSYDDPKKKHCSINSSSRRSSDYHQIVGTRMYSRRCQIECLRNVNREICGGGVSTYGSIWGDKEI